MSALGQKRTSAEVIQSLVRSRHDSGIGKLVN
jgi:hypothetical protein